jgi:subtilisin
MRSAARLAATALLFVMAATTLAPQPAAAVSPHQAPGAATAAEATAPADPTAPLSAQGRYIVMLKDGKGVDAATGRAGKLGVKADKTFRHAVRGYSAHLTTDQLANVRADPDVQAVVPDEVISIAGQSIPTGVRRVNGRESLIAGIDGAGPQVDADVAIVDTGIGGKDSRLHEDLNIAGGINCATSDPERWGDQNGHGTHVAGIVGALDNGIGVVGVAPGVRLWSVRILDSAGNGLVSWYVCGLDWIAAQRDPLDPTRPLFEAVNMSVAKKGTDDHACGVVNGDLMHQAICRLVASGVTVVAAAGNNSFNAANLKPASYDEVITVSALADSDGKAGGIGGASCLSFGAYDKDDTFADFSNYGADVDLIAPGNCILSTLPGNRYGYISGTSMAAPHVTGAVALYKASRPLATPVEVKGALRAAGTLDWNTATDRDSIHEPLLDVSHLVALGDFTLDATPGTSHSALVGRAGASLELPVSLFRAEDFPAAVHLSVSADTPLTANLDTETLAGQDQVATVMRVAVPAGTASGSYTLTVTADDGTRQRVSTFPVVVDNDPPSATAAVLALRPGSSLGSGLNSVGTWSAASDPTGTISRYEVRWLVDGLAGGPITLSSTARQATRTMKTGHTYALRLRARDAAGNWSPSVESAAFAPVLSQDTSPTLARSGGWTRYLRSWMSGGSSLYSRTRSSWIERSFTGRAIALVGSKSRGRGKARVYIDGTLAATVDFHRSSTAHRQVVFTRSWSTVQPHTLRLVVLGTSGRPRVDVDAFVVVP